jgi:predicted SAM-dependent methyltransferase
LESLIKPESIDWIETDGLFEFFNYSLLTELLSIWRRVLSSDGFISTTATSTNNYFDIFFDKFKILAGKFWLGVKVYSHARQEIWKIFDQTGFNFVEGPTIVPYFKRYSLCKK